MTDTSRTSHTGAVAAPGDSGILDEALQRLHASGPERMGRLTNHGPMAVEALVRGGQGHTVHRWLDYYRAKLEDMPAPGTPVTDADWRTALGDPRRAADWIGYFERALAERPWREVLAAWWPVFLPGISGGSTHPVIRVGHAVRSPSKMGGEASMRFCLDAIDAAQRKLIDAVVTAPIAKESWKLAGYGYPGHTELFAQRTGARRHAMMFTGGPLKVVLATVHIPLMGVWNKLNIGAVFQPIELLQEALVNWFDIPKPRIAVAGVNPHASENGQFGDEEERIIDALADQRVAVQVGHGEPGISLVPDLRRNLMATQEVLVLALELGAELTLLLLAAILGLLAKSEMKQFSPVPKRFMRTVQEDLKWARTQMKLSGR